MSEEGRAIRPWRSQIPDPWVSLFVVAAFGLLAFRLWTLIDHHSVNVLFWDQWDFYEALFENQGAWDLFRFQHGPHRQGIGFWLTGLVAHLTSWDTRADAFATIECDEVGASDVEGLFDRWDLKISEREISCGHDDGEDAFEHDFSREEEEAALRAELDQLLGK